ALNELTPAQRQAIALNFLEGLSHQEIAERLDTPLGTVKSNIRRGLLRLRQLLDGGVAQRD
ncbi:MAG: helix-turn-helix domain-containing protein, partial [Salinisphaera sp.]|nr:helix-turn-helix domain-containing protein [Salinisphaera sp.]